MADGENTMSTLEILFILLALGGFTVFAGCLAWADYQTRHIAH
jgi:hypothetical protein